MTATVRLSRDADAALILDVVEDAFSAPDHDADEEIDIVRRTWVACHPPRLLELVADDSLIVVGHVMAAPGDLGGQEVLGVAPLCVASERQDEGIGSALMEGIIDHATERGWPLLLVLGDAAYYERFGFEAAWPLHITYPPAGWQSPHFMARRLPGYDPGLRGEFRYCWETDSNR